MITTFLQPPAIQLHIGVASRQISLAISSKARDRSALSFFSFFVHFVSLALLRILLIYGLDLFLIITRPGCERTRLDADQKEVDVSSS